MSTLKAVGVFWDIENCCVPKGKSALKIIERIRERFFQDFREAEFICVCDITKESDSTIKDLNDGQINVVHINATAKNAADDKIRQSMRRFSDSHPPGTKVILISSDVNFASDLSDLRHRKKFEVVLIHKAQVSEALLTCASEHFLYEELIKDLPVSAGQKEVADTVCIAYGYDKEVAPDKVSAILKMVSSNCGGKVISIGPLYAVLKFTTPELTERAKKRMNGLDIYGRKITVCLPEESPFNLSSKKWGYLSKRRESPSPQRRPPRERYKSRSYTPEDGFSGGGGGQGSITGHESDYSKGYGDYTLVPASEFVDRKGFKTPGGPVSKDSMGICATSLNPGMGDSPVSPNQVHTLPNSNSARYYIKSSDLLMPSDFQERIGRSSNDTPPVKTQAEEAQALLKKMTLRPGSSTVEDAGKDGPVLSLGPSLQQMSLKDIPLPPSGYQFMPPPNMPPPSISKQQSTPKDASADSKASTFDPIVLFENTSKDSQMLKPGLLGPVPSTINQTNQEYGFRNKFHPGAYFKHPEPAVGGGPRFGIKQQQHQAGQLHQSRSVSMPGPAKESSDSVSSSGMPFKQGHGHSLGSGPRSHSQTGPGRDSAAGSFKKYEPSQQQLRCHSGGFNSRQSPVTRPASTGQAHVHPSPTIDSQNRPYNQSQQDLNPTSSKDFRPRLPSAPSTSIPVASFSDSGKRTPSPFSGLQPPTRQLQRQKGSNIYRVPTPVEMGDPSSDYFHPDFRPNVDPYVELIVSNLDYNISPFDWRKVIYATFQPHVKILSIQVRLQADNTSVATLRLPTEHDARFAISQYHRRKIGYKRINVQLKSDCSQSPAESLRMDTIALLMEEKDNKMALSRLIDLFDKRFHKTVSVSDVYKMRDTIQIMEVGGGGRWVKLQPGIRRTPTPTQNTDGEVIEALEQPVCTIHCVEGSEHYTDALNSCMLPNVLLLRKHFSPQLHSLLLSHNGYIPLMSFPACYAAEFSLIEPEKKGGIPLEHVISCVPGVEICVSKAGVKVIQFQQNREPFYDLMKGNSWQELGKISREVMELLRQQPTCAMPVSRFIPAYHHYFGKQCRVADYGYTKLQELFEAIPHAIQVLGTGDRKAITLSPRAQLKRFTTDIVKVVKAQPSKQLLLDKFPAAYEEVMGKSLLLAHYGVCFMEDILSDIPTTTLIVIEEENHVLLALPRRDQTPEEVERTKKFSLEVVDLLKTCPQCCMPFNKFIPAYHHHFGRQCRVADYGFSKLADLFESVSHVVRLEDEGEERLIQLTVTEMRAVLCEQLTSLIRSAGAIPVCKIQQAYGSRFNFGLKLSDYGADSTRLLLLQLKNHIKIEIYNGQEFATLVKEFQIPTLGLQVMQLLMDESGGSLPLQELCTRYQSMFGHPCDLAEIRDKLGDFIQIEESTGGGGIIRLSLHQSLGRNLRLLLLHQPNQRVAMSDLYRLYRQQYSVELSPALYGFSSLYQLLLSFPHILEVRGKPTHKFIILSGLLATPGVLPPTRVDVTSPQQFSGPKEVKTIEPASSVPSVSGSGATTLMHASQLWDSAIISQSPPMTTAIESSQPSNAPAASTRIMNMLSASSNALAKSRAQKNGEANMAAGISLGQAAVTNPSKKILSRNGVQLEWQSTPEDHKVTHEKLGRSPSRESKLDQSESEGSGYSGSPHQLQQQSCGRDGNILIQSDHFEEEAAEDRDLFSLDNLPLETSSSTSQLNSSSQSSPASSSPVKQQRTKPRIAANFGKQQSC